MLTRVARGRRAADGRGAGGVADAHGDRADAAGFGGGVRVGDDHLFGLSTSFPLSVLAYAAVGAADQVSMVMRQNTIQLATPDALRGRVTAVNSVFISASNQLGAVESGFVAAATSAMFAVVSGGIACLGVVGIIAWRVPELREYRASDQPPE